jgi:hypothetical protein
MMPDWLYQLIAAGAGAGGLYAAIRADLATLHERSTNALDTAKRAHDRIDNFQQHGRRT